MKHRPVLREEVLRLLAPRAGGRYLDATFGGGGHARALLEAAEGTVVHAIDRDPEASRRAEEEAGVYGPRFAFFAGNFDGLDACLPEGSYDGILFDLGVSSFQLETAARGFSFQQEGPLDMRMNPGEGYAAADWLANATRDELIEAVRDYGEERQWRRVVEAILRARESGSLRNTVDLARVVAAAKLPGRFRGGPGKGSVPHPATLVFQGIRIAVNDELGALRRALPLAFERLAAGGVLAAISFHSLEDRIVKRYFRRLCGEPEHAGDSLPQQLRECRATLLTRRPITASEEELARNPRSRSAKLRALKKMEYHEKNDN